MRVLAHADQPAWAEEAAFALALATQAVSERRYEEAEELVGEVLAHLQSPNRRREAQRRRR